jgi:hypothetical protein
LTIIFSRHALEKLEDETSKRLGLTPDLLKRTLNNPELIDNTDFPVLTAIGKLTEALSLSVVYKFVETGIKVITFFPARKGRYERKILS